MNRISLFSFLVALGLSFQASAQPGPLDFQLMQAQSKEVQVVFALDVTGSMSGLLRAAKDKIWTIANSLAQADDQVNISIGIVAYRDRGDAFVTQITDLSTDLDMIYTKLNALSAGGGGDGPESVNKALNDAVNHISWSREIGAMRTIFLVGDCQPHMDYADEKQYPEICKEAAQKDIVINSILMGTDNTAKTHWESIAMTSGGDFFDVGMDAGNLAVNSPFDARINQLNQNLDATMLHYGTTAQVQEAEKNVERADQLYLDLDDAALARRASYNMTESGRSNQFATNELLEAVRTGEVALLDLETEMLPDTLQGLSMEDRQLAVDSLLDNRAEIELELNTLVQERKVYLEASAVSGKSGFAQKVWDALRVQGKKKQMALPKTVSY